MSVSSRNDKSIWDRSQPWRQGSLISVVDCARLNIFPEQSEEYMAAVISHDCDCLAGLEVDANIEVILAKVSKSPTPNNMHAKNPRTLQLECKEFGQSIDLDIRAKAFISKKILSAITPEISIRFSREEKRILARWLASRYDRGALPDELQSRLQVVEETIEKAGKTHPNAILGIYIYYEPDKELPKNELYIVDLRIVYAHDDPDPLAREKAETAAQVIDTRFRKKFFTGDNGIRPCWEKIELENCSALSDIDFTLFDVMSYTQLKLEHISLRQVPIGDLPIFQ
jgi:hypothetical protein